MSFLEDEGNKLFKPNKYWQREYKGQSAARNKKVYTFPARALLLV